MRLEYGMPERLAATQSVVWSEMAGEIVILDLRNGLYYGLNEVGTTVWKLLQEPRTSDEIRDRVLQEYEVGSEECESSLERLLVELRARDLLVTVEGDG